MLAQFENPGSLAFGCFIWAPLAVWIVSLVHWMVMGEIDAISGVFGIFVAFGMGYLGLNPPFPDLPMILFVASLATVALAPMTRVAMNRSALSALDVEAIGRAYELLASKPDNFGAKFRLARSLYNKGIVGHAIAIADSALKNVPERMFPEEFRMLQQWKAHAGKLDAQERIRCFECGVPNYPGAVFCSRCGAPYLLDYAQGRWMKSTMVKRVLVTWIFAMLCVIGIPTAAVIMPLFLSIPTILLLMALGIILLVSGFKESGGNKP